MEKEKTTLCKLCGGKAIWWDKECSQRRMTDRGMLAQSWRERWIQCLEDDCKEKYELPLGDDHYKEKDLSFYSGSQPDG